MQRPAMPDTWEGWAALIVSLAAIGGTVAAVYHSTPVQEWIKLVTAWHKHRITEREVQRKFWRHLAEQGTIERLIADLAAARGKDARLQKLEEWKEQSVLPALAIEQLREENTRQHAATERRIDAIEAKLDRLIWHLLGERPGAVNDTPPSRVGTYDRRSGE